MATDGLRIGKDVCKWKLLMNLCVLVYCRDKSDQWQERGGREREREN